MYPVTRSLASGVTTGPISELGSRPGPTLMASARSRSFSTSGSAASPTATAIAIAMQRCPAEPKPAAVSWSAAKSRSASGRTIAWFFAPPSAWTRLPCALPRSWMYFAIGVEPTKEIAATSGWSSRASTATLSPWTTLKTPSGSPASAYSSATRFEADGSRSDGLRTKVLPVAMASGCIHSGTIIGKLNGVMPTQTPSGWRKENESTSDEIWSEYSPLSSCGMPHANSATSMPRMISPLASSTTLPCSLAMIRASSSVCASSRLRNANMIFARRLIDVSLHAGNAAFAAPTAASTSAGSASTTSAWGCPVAGSQTIEVRVELPVVSSPPIRCRIVLVAVVLICAYRPRSFPLRPVCPDCVPGRTCRDATSWHATARSPS